MVQPERNNREPVSGDAVSRPTAPRDKLDLRTLDALRGVAALYVVVCHATALLWSGMNPAGRSGLAANVFHGLVDYSPVAVVLFFIISGFCIHYGKAHRLSHSAPASMPLQTLNVRSFAVRRTLRLEPPLILALVITAICDIVGHHVNLGFYEGPKPDEINWLGDSHTLPTLVGNLGFQASLSVPVFGTDSPLWSLGYEFWFYAFYPVLFLVTARYGPWKMFWLAAVGSILSALMSRVTDTWMVYVLINWVVWASGAVLAEAYVGRIHLPGLRWAGLLGLLAIPVLSQLFPYHLGGRGQPKDILWGAAFVAVLAYVLLEPSPRVKRLVEHGARRLDWLGRISYWLYLVHVPLLALLAAWWHVSHPSLPTGIELAVVGVSAALGLGWISWYLVERHFVSGREAAPSARAAARNDATALAA